MSCPLQVLNVLISKFQHTPILVELTQHRYGHVVHDGHVVEFDTLNGFPINLYQAFTKDLDDLVNKNEPAFSPDMNVRAKASIRIQASFVPIRIGSLSSHRTPDSSHPDLHASIHVPSIQQRSHLYLQGKAGSYHRKGG